MSDELDDFLEDTRAASAAAVDQLAAAIFQDVQIATDISTIAEMATRLVEQLQDRGVPLDQAMASIVGGIAGQIVKGYTS